MEPKPAATLYIIRSKATPELAILCTETHIIKWVNMILKKGEDPEVRKINYQELKQLLKPNPNLN